MWWILKTFSLLSFTLLVMTPAHVRPLSGWTTERHLSQALGYEGPGTSDVSGRHQKVPSAPLLPGQGND